MKDLEDQLVKHVINADGETALTCEAATVFPSPDKCRAGSTADSSVKTLTAVQTYRGKGVNQKKKLLWGS